MKNERLPEPSAALPAAPQISVIVPTHGRPESMTRLLGMLAEQTLTADAFEVIVVDDGSQPALAFDLWSVPYRCRVTHQPWGGPASARNVGLALAASPLVLFLTDDAVPAPDLLERHLEAHGQMTEPGAVLGSFRFTDEARRNPFTRLLDETDLFQQFSALRDGERYGWPFFWTSNLSAPTDVFLAVGGFDEVNFDQPLCEGLDLGLRLEEQGIGVVHRADCVAHHDHVITASSFFARGFELGRYQLRLGSKVGAPDVFFEEGTVTAEGLRPDIVEVLEQQREVSESIQGQLVELDEQVMDADFTPEQLTELVTAVSDAVQYPRLCGLYFESTGIDFRAVSRDSAPEGTSVSIIAVSCNALANTQRCVEALRRGADDRYPQEILIVDNGSTDGSAEWLEAQPDIKLVRNPYNFGAPRARNQAIRHAQGDWVAFLDNDVFVPEGWLDRALYHGAVDPAVGSIPLCANRASKHQVIEYHGSDDGEELQRFADAHFESAPRRGMDATLFTSLGVLVRAEALDRIGGFDEAFSPWGFEDDDIALRVRLSGWRNRVARDTFVYHAFYDGPAKVERHNGWMEQNWRAFLTKWSPAAAGSPLFDYSRVQLPQLGEATEAQIRFNLPSPDAAPPTWPGAEHPATGFQTAGEGPQVEEHEAYPAQAEAPDHEALPGGAPAGPGTAPVVLVGASEAALETARALLFGQAAAEPEAGSEVVAINEYLLSAAAPDGGPLGRLQQRFLFTDRGLTFEVEPCLRDRMDRAARSFHPLHADPRFCHTLPAWRASFGEARFVCVFDDPATAGDETLRTLVRVPEYGGVALDFEGATELWRQMYRRVLDEHSAEGEWLFIHADELATAEGRARLEAFTGVQLQPSPLRAVTGSSQAAAPVRASIAETYRELCHRASCERPVSIQGGPVHADGSAPVALSVIVQVEESVDALRRCLTSLEDQTAKGCFEVILVDRGHVEGSEAWLDAWTPSFPSRRVDAAGSSTPAAWNRGLAAATAELVLFLDGDAAAAPDLVECHLVAHGETGPDRAVVGAVTPAASVGSNALMRAFGGEAVGPLSGNLDVTRLHDWTAFRLCNASVSRAAVMDAGGVAEEACFAACVDLELGFRLQELAGVRVVHRDEAHVAHHRTWTFQALRQWTRARAASELQLIAAHPAAGRHRIWRDRLAGTARRHDELVVQTLPDRARAESFAQELSQVHIGTFERTGADGEELAGVLLAQLHDYLTELAHIWRAEGELTALHGLGVEAVGDLLSAGAESSGTGASALVA